MIARYALALAAALAAMAGWSAYQQQKGVVRERARVVAEGERTNAKAQAARAKVEKKAAPDIRADLRRFCVDCN